MENVAYPRHEVEQSLLVSTMLHYGRKIKHERQSRLAQKFSELRVKLSSGAAMPFVLQMALAKHMFNKAKSALFTGEDVPPLFRLAEGSSPEDMKSYAVFQERVLKSPLFWLVAGISAAVQVGLTVVTAGASAKIIHSVRLAVQAPSVATVGKAFVDYGAARGTAAGFGQNAITYGSVRALFHFTRHRKEVKELRRKAKDLRFRD